MEDGSLKQIKSKDRVQSFGEVYTSKSEVNNMIDLVWGKLYSSNSKIKTTFLEPSVGTGNFLVEVLDRKFNEIMKQRNIKKNEYQYQINTFIALSTLYGIDILPDNVEECRKNMMMACINHYKKVFKKDIPDNLIKSFDYILSKNIICGDSLTGLKDGEEATPIIISEWSIVGSKVKRSDFALNDLVTYGEIPSKKKDRISYKIVSFKEVFDCEWIKEH